MSSSLRVKTLVLLHLVACSNLASGQEAVRGCEIGQGIVDSIRDKENKGAENADASCKSEPKIVNDVQELAELVLRLHQRIECLEKKNAEQCKEIEKLHDKLAVSSYKDSPEYSARRIKEILKPTVLIGKTPDMRVNRDREKADRLDKIETGSSGTILFSGTNPKTGSTETIVLTNHHVVEKYVDERTAKTGIALPIKSKTIKISTFKYDGRGQMTEATTFDGKVIASDTVNDLALIQIMDVKDLPSVTLAHPKYERVSRHDKVILAGCPQNSLPSERVGEISDIGDLVDGVRHIGLTALAFFGNSGGGIYNQSNFKYVGTFSKIYTSNYSVNDAELKFPIPAMGLFIDNKPLFELLEEAKLDFIWNPSRM